MFKKSRGLLLAFTCLTALAGGSLELKAQSAFDASKLPRVSGAKEIFASPATTIFVSPDPVAATADRLEQTLAAAGWQRYVAPLTASASNPNLRIMSLKKDGQALNVMVSIAPAQGNKTSVQYSALPLKTDLPFSTDATNIEFDPNRPLLLLVTAEPIGKTLAFYRKELAARGWSLWSAAANGKQAAGGPDGDMHERGASAQYISDKSPSSVLALTLQKLDGGKFKVEIKPMPAAALASMHQAYLNGDNRGSEPVKVSDLPRLAGATDDPSRSSPDKTVYSVAKRLAETSTAVNALLGAQGWKPYVEPLEKDHSTLAAFKKGRQGLSVSYTIQVGKNEKTSERTTVYYSPARINFALPFPDDATGIVFDQNRPYLNAMSAAPVDALLSFYSKELPSSGWQPVPAPDLAAKFPNAKIDDKPAYFTRGGQRVIALSLQRNGDKTNVEIRVPPFARPQTLEAGSGYYGLPSPKLIKSAGATDGRPERTMFAHVPAEIDTVLTFYRRELAARNWKEEAQGAVLKPDEVILNYTPPEGKAVLKLTHKYDLTIVSIVQQIPKPVVVAQPDSGNGMGSIDSMMKEMGQMMRQAGADIPGGLNPPAAPPAAQNSSAPLRALADNKAPVPVPADAEDVEFDGSDGKLEFSSPSGVKAVADFYRSAMKQQGWQSHSSVINNANMVVLNFAKGGKPVVLTIMKMGPKTNVSADGDGLKGAAGAPDKTAKADTDAPPPSADDLIVEESGGLPMPKNHTMSTGTRTPFRRELNATVPMSVAVMTEFYRRELGRLNWKEAGKGTVAADRAALRFAAPEGPAMLKIERKGKETSIVLILKDPGAAAKAGIAPKPGQAKVLFGNILPNESSLTFNNKAVKVKAGAGTKAPDGPALDLKPGKYKFSIKPANKPPQVEEIEVGPDETWGLMIGPGGVLPLQAY